MTGCWTLRLAASAEQDIRNILRWTTETFGRGQARIYAKTLTQALRDLTRGPTVDGVRLRQDIGSGIHALHVARKGRKGRHFVVFRVSPAERTIDVLRLLHDSMDLPRHLDLANDAPT